MSFVEQRIRELNARIQVIQLQTGSNLRAQNKTATTLRSPSLQGVLTTLDGLDQKQKVALLDDSDEWTILAQCTVVVYGSVIDRLLNDTLPLGQDGYYWSDIEESVIWSGLYFVQSKLESSFDSLAYVLPSPSYSTLSCR